MLLPMEIGDRIRRARDLAGMSQTELAQAAGVTRGLVGNWESHRKKPGREVLMRLAEALGVSAASLLGEPVDGAETLTTSNPEEIAAIRLLRRLTPGQRKMHIQLLGEAVSVRREIEKHRSPSKGQPVGT